jgi:hypothetical protein
MASAAERLAKLQAEINQTNRPDWDPEEIRRLNFWEVGGLLHIEYYGLFNREYEWPLVTGEDEGDPRMLPVFETLALPEVAHKTASLSFDGPDEGHNGTRDWDFGWLLEQETSFPELRRLVITPTKIGDYNFTVVSSTFYHEAGNYQKRGQFAEWLKKAPKLEHLTTPSAPEEAFFQVGHRSLRSMRVDAGFDPETFILNLSRSTSPRLDWLDFGESNIFHKDLWEEYATPYEHYEALFRSPACPGAVVIRNPNLTDEQLEALAALQQKTRRGRAFLQVIRTLQKFPPDD